jgi:hypothetical protein
MATSIPLVASTIRPIEQPDALQNFARIQALRQQQQNAPLQNQILQNQAQIGQQTIQTGQLDLQQKQIELKDQQAMNAAMNEWSKTAGGTQASTAGGTPAPSAAGGAQTPSSMPNYDDLINLAKKNGASFKAIQGLQTSVLAMREKASTIAKDDAQTGSDNATALKTKTGLITDAMSGVMNLPDDQIVQGLTSAANELSQKGLLDPQHVQMAQQLAQSGDPAAIRKALTAQIAGMGGFTKMVDDAQKQTELDQKKAARNFYQQAGGAPGVSAELMQQADWLKKNPGKGPSDYKLWVMKNTPAAVIANSNLLGGQSNQDALDFAANNYRQTGQMPAGFTRSPQTTSAIITRAAQLDQQAGGGGIASNKATLKSYSDALDGLQKNYSAVSAFEDTANKNIEMLKGIARNVPDLGVKFANVPVRMFTGNMIGTDNMAAFKTALLPVQTEAAKILNSANLSGSLSDSSRHELQDIVDGNATYSALVSSLNVLQQDFKNRKSGFETQINDLQGRIKGMGSTGGQSNSAQPQTGGAVPAGATHIVPGRDGKNHYTNAQGTVDLGIAP